MASDENSFFGLKVPEGTDRRELYKSQYRAIYTYKMSAAELAWQEEMGQLRSAWTQCQVWNERERVVPVSGDRDLSDQR